MKIRFGALTLALALAACSSGTAGEEPAPKPTQPAKEQPSPEPEPVEEPSGDTSVPHTTIATTHLATDIEVAVFPLRSDGELALARLDFRAPASNSTAVELQEILSRDSKSYAGVETVRLIDRENEVIYLAAADASGDFAATSDKSRFRIEAGGEPYSHYVYFSSPPGASTDLHIPFLGYVPNVPIEQIDAGEQLSDLAPDVQIAGPVVSEEFSLGAWAVEYDDLSTLGEEDGLITWTLAADVLFDFGEYELDSDAVEAITAVVEQVRDLAVEGGEIKLVGHTDDQGPKDFNQRLSEQRAASVRDVFAQELGPNYSLSAEGKGMTEPAVEGTSEEARAANRRVEIYFEAEERKQIATRGAHEAPPETDAPTVRGNEQLEFAHGSAGADIGAVSIASVTALDDAYLLGIVEVEVLSAAGDSSLFSTLFSDPGLSKRTSDTFESNGAGLITLATGNANLYPVEYVAGENRNGSPIRDLVADPRPLGSYAPGEKYRLSVVWPNPGTETVTIEVPGRMRFAEVPVM